MIPGMKHFPKPLETHSPQRHYARGQAVAAKEPILPVFPALLRGFLSIAYPAIVFWYGYDVFAYGDVTPYAENGPIENMQAALLLLSTLIFAAPTVFSRSPDRLLFWFFAWLCYTFLLREVNVATFDVPNIIKFVAAGRSRDVILVLMLLTIVGVGLARARHTYLIFRRFARSLPGLLIFLCGVCLIIGDIFEKSSGIRYHEFFEEALELGGYCLMLLGAVETHCGKHRGRRDCR